MLYYIDEEIDVASLVQDEEASDIVQLIKQQELELVKLRRRLNQFLPSKRIPDDVLVRILYHSVRMDHEAYWEWQHNTSSWAAHGGDTTCPGWIRGSRLPLVCQRWKDLVMNHPRLWSIITAYDREQYTQAAVVCSEDAPLRLLLATPRSQEDDLFHKLMEHLPRTYSLEYCFDQVGSYSGQDLHPSDNFDQLRGLHIWRNPNSDSEEVVGEDQLILSLAAASLPNLTSLTIQHIPQSMCSVLTRPTLTFLEIANDYHLYNYGKIGTWSILTVLAELPFLEVLRLEFPSLPGPVQDGAWPDLADADLPNLEEFKLRTQSDACIHLLSYISLDPSVSLSVSIVGVWPDDEDIPEPLPSHLSQQSGSTSLTQQIMQKLRPFKLDDMPAPHRLVLTHHDRDVGYTVQLRHESERTAETNETLSIADDEDLNIEVTHWTEHLDCVVDHLPLQEIETIELKNSHHALDLPHPSEATTLQHIANHWNRKIAASSVIFSGTLEAFTSFLSALAQQSVQSEDPEEQCGIALPRLETIVGFCDGVRSTDSAENDPSDYDLRGPLNMLLERRQEAGVPIKRFVWHQSMGGVPPFSQDDLDGLHGRLDELNVESVLNTLVYG